jgi:hypothetical protein
MNLRSVPVAFAAASFLATTFYLATTAAVYAQSTGRITGSVTDASGAAVPGATVSLHMSGGSAAIQTATTTSDGLFSFAAIQPGAYDLSVGSSGFASFSYRAAVVNAARETVIPTIKLELKSVQQTVEVTGDVQTVQTANIENSTSVTQQQVANLPVLDRQVSNLFLTQPGVSSGRGPTTVNGLRTSMVNATFEGVNIQDNFIRVNDLDYIPSKFTIEQVSELTVTSSNANASIGGGAAQIIQVAPSGSNQTHGTGYWYNRNNYFAANDWFNNRAGVGVPFLNQNQLGGSAGGHIVKDKLFYYGNYEAFRNHQQSPQTRVILTPTARQGAFQYLAGGKLNQVNVLSAKGIKLDSYIQQFIAQTPAAGNSTDVGDGLNTTGYRFNQRANEIRDAVTSKFDYIPSSKHAISGAFVWNRDVVDRPTLDNTFNPAPAVFNDNNSKLVSVAWRWTARANLNNELRAGMFLAPSNFAVNQAYPKFLLGSYTEATAIGNTPLNTTLFIDNPSNTFLSQGRTTNTYNLQDNLNWVKGKHNMFFGFQTQQVTTQPYNDFGVVPFYNSGLPSSNTTGFTSGELPGISSGDLSTANNLYAFLGGFVNDYAQTFNITSRSSGYVNGATNLRHYTYGTYAGYFQDNWKVLPRLTLNLGLRYDYYARVNERDGLTLLPRLVNHNFIQTLMSNATLDFAGNSTGNPYYHKDLNNFAPNVGFAWDAFGNGRTALRGGYSISYVNDDLITSVRQNTQAAAGLTSAVTNPTTAGFTSAPPSVPTPAFQVPRTEADNYALSTAATLALPDPNLRTPYVQQWSVGVQHEAKGAVVELRYVGNHGTKELRQIDYNQINPFLNGFLADFNRARGNLFLSPSGSPAYNPAISGSQPLTYISNLPQGGSLTNSTVISNIRTGQAAELANFYATRPSVYGTLPFYPNPLAQNLYSLSNLSNSTYNALQFDVRKRTRNGMAFQFNYTYSKALGDGAGDNQTRLEPLLDNHNLKLEHSREPFDLTHVLKANYSVNLPFGKGTRFDGGRFLNQVIGGWNLAGIFTSESGTAFSILSGRGTYNRAGRSAINTVSTNLTKSQLDAITGFFMTANGPYFIAPGVINTDGRGAATDGSTPFAGQVFFNPDPGSIGTLNRRWFSGPWNTAFDMGASKSFRYKDRHTVQLRAEAFNVFNHPTFYAGNESSSVTRFTVNNTTFGRSTSTFYAPRVMQLSLRYSF